MSSAVVIAEPDHAASRALRAAVEACRVAKPIVAPSLEEAIILGAKKDAGVLLVGPSISPDRAADVVAAAHLGTACQLLLVAKAPSTDLMRHAMRAGFRDVIPDSAPTAELTAAVELALVHSSSSASLAHMNKDGSIGKVVTSFSTKGGVGKSFLATNLAVSLATSGMKVALLDLDTQFGDVGIMMGLLPQHTIFDAMLGYDRLDARMLEGVMTKHSSGVDVLLAPTRPEDAEGVTSQRVAGLIDLVRSIYDVVVIDTAPVLNDLNFTILDSSDSVYVITTMDIASIKNTRISLQKLGQLGYDPSALRLVLNRSDSKVLLNLSEVEKTLGGSVAHIPSDLVVPRCVNKGVTVVADSPKSKVARAISGIAHDVIALVGREAKSNVA